MYLYCACGAKTAQTSSPVKFCSSCGNPFYGTAPAKTPTQTIKASFKRTEEDEEIEDDIDLDEEDTEYEEELTQSRAVLRRGPVENPFTIEVNEYQPVKLGEIATSTRPPQALPPGKKLKTSKKQFLENWKKQAGTTRSK